MEQIKTESLLIEDVRKMLKKLFEANNIELSDIDWILASVCACSKSKLLTLTRLNKEQYKNLLKIVKQRLKGKPLQYVLGTTNFFGFNFKVNKNVLIPRFDTEVLVEAVVKAAKIMHKPRILDLCTGSGCIGISVALLTGAYVLASDISTSALDVAKHNAAALKAQVEFVKSDLFEKISNANKFDIIVSNPPYIEEGELKWIDNTVKNYEPHLALIAGQDGLKFHRHIISQAPAFLKQGGLLFLEVGNDQAIKVNELLREKWADVKFIYDLNSVARVIVATKK